MNELKMFENQQFGKLRTMIIDGEIWFVGKDVAECLGYSKARNAIASHVMNEDKKDAPIQGPLGGTQNMTIINESGLYSLVFSSRLEGAKQFKHWVTSDVLPSIRKHGAYMTPETIERALLSPDFIIKLATKLKEEQEKNRKLQETIDDMEPKVEYYNKVANSDELLTITVIAKAYGLNAQQLNKYLHEKKIQFKVGNTWCLYSKYKDMGLIRIITVPVTRNGYETTYTTMRWTHKGKLFIHNLLVSDGFRVIEEVA